MKLIGAGLPRTATLTQKVALEMLGFGPCYHMVNVLADLSQVPLWHRAADGTIDWEEIMGGFESTVDWPGGFFYRELIDAYPDAKVLLSVRDPEAWERSMRDTVWEFRHGDTLMPHVAQARARIDPDWSEYIRMLDRLLWEDQGTLTGNHHDPQWLIECFHRHNQAVQENVPADRLLVWAVKDGWEPLCEFLEVDVPDAPMPNINDKATFVDRVVFSGIDVLHAWSTQEQQQRQELAAAH
jgi:Sulfotransferase domain